MGHGAPVKSKNSRVDIRKSQAKGRAHNYHIYMVAVAWSANMPRIAAYLQFSFTLLILFGLLFPNSVGLFLLL